MASTTALFTGLSGLTANARRLEVIGNNIANANTTAFKASRMMFQTQLVRTLSAGSPPGETTGGRNPSQVGLGVAIAGTQRDFSPGSISTTGDARDLAIDGRGFFVVQRGEDRLFTRAGNFRQTSTNDLVTIDGARVMGFGVDANSNIVEGELVPINIPLGTARVAEATRQVRLSGNLDAQGSVATQGAQVSLMATETEGLSLIPGATRPPQAGHRVETDSLLVEIADPQATSQPLFSPGQVLELAGVEKGGRILATTRFTISALTTVGDLLAFLRDVLAIVPEAGPNPDGRMPGVTLDATAGRITITGNSGTINDIHMESSDLRLLDATGQFVRSPLAARIEASATGESARTTFVAYDSLGSALTVDLGVVLEARDDGGTRWRYYLESPFDSGPSSALTSGTIRFDTQGQLQSPQPVRVRVDRAGTGARTPLEFDVHFAAGADAVTALAASPSQIAAVFQDGSAPGVLASFGIGEDGTITGSFTNGLTRTLGRLALATFANQDGLLEESSNLYRVGHNSGPPVVTVPGGFGTGRIVSGALETSNVDLGQEFINMIMTSTGYSAASRVIRTTDELLQQLLVLGR